MTGSTSQSFRSLSRVVVGGLILSLMGATGATILPVDQASAGTGAGACAGVTVVVDFTDLGGGAKQGCAVSGFDTGIDALHSAGFASADSQPGLVCTIDAKPDPCPATFEGSFWSYWHGESGDTEWTSYQIGSATSHPVAGSVEGWRYNDGKSGPGLSPHDAVVQAAATPTATATTPTDTATATTTTAPQGQQTDVVALIIGGVLIVLIGTALAVLLLRRRTGRIER
jgi:hypothetical protein